MVCELLPLRLTDPRATPPLGAANPASGSGNAVMPMVGVGWKLALPVARVPPTTWMLAAVTWALPLADRAVVELESTTTEPGMLMLAFPERVRAPLAVGF